MKHVLGSRYHLGWDEDSWVKCCTLELLYSWWPMGRWRWVIGGDDALACFILKRIVAMFGFMCDGPVANGPFGTKIYLRRPIILGVIV